MTVIQPNSVAGINSITVQSGNSLAVHKANGELIRTITSNSGVSTFSSISVGTAYTDNSAAKSINIGVGASISQHDANTLTFGTAGDPVAKFDANGGFLVGNGSNFTDSNSGNTKFIEVGTAGSGDALLVTHASGSGVGYFGYEAGGDRLVIACDGGSGNKIDFITDAGTTTGGGTDNLNGKVPKMRITAGGDINIGAAATIKANGNATFSGIVTATSFKGDGSGLSGISAGTSLSGSTNNTVTTVTGANAIQGESNLTFDGTRLNVGGTGVSQNRTVNIGSDSEANLAIETHNTSSSETANIRFYRSRGTAASPTTLVDGDVIAQHIFYGHDGTDYANTAAVIKVLCSSTVASNSVPSSMTFFTNGGSTSATERLRISHMGDLLMGNSTGYSIWKLTGNDQFCRYQFRQTTGNNRGAAFLEERGDANGMDVFISKSRGGNGVGAITSGDILGNLKFTGADGTRQHNAATIQVYNSGTIATGRVAGNMSFYTAPDSVNQQIERLRIDSSGHVLLPADDVNIKIGASADLQLYHNGTDSYISNSTNKLRIGNTHDNGIKFFTNGSTRWNIEGSGHIIPDVNDAYDIGSTSYRVRNIYTGDLNLSNEGSKNDVDGTWGSYTIQEGENDLFLINKRSGKKYTFNLTEVA